MIINLPWIKTRKRIFFSSVFDFFILFLVYKFILSINITLLNAFNFINYSFVWCLTSYILGRYTSWGEKKNSLFYPKKIFKLITLSIIFYLYILIINLFTDSISDFINNSSIDFLIYSSIFSFIAQLITDLYLSFKGEIKRYVVYFGDKDIFHLLEKINLSNLRRNEISLHYFTNKESLPKKIDEVIIQNVEFLSKENYKFLYKKLQKGLSMFSVSNWCEKQFQCIPSRTINNNELFNINWLDRSRDFHRRLKRIADLIISILILFLLFPLLVIVSILIKLEDGGPIFYSQLRTGLYGKQIKIVKFRSMKVDSEKNGPQWASKFDKRITIVGSIIRASRVDELPQLLSVLKGEMSLIGPRPERQEIEEFLFNEIPLLEMKNWIKPGLSGWAQVNYPYGASVQDSEMKFSYDLFYLKNYSLWLDLLIFFKTLRLVINRAGASPKSL